MKPAENNSYYLTVLSSSLYDCFNFRPPPPEKNVKIVIGKSEPNAESNIF